MKDNTYRIILGAIVLAALYFEVREVIYAVIAVTLFEGITNWRIPKIVNRTMKRPETAAPASARFNFEAERAFRFTVGGFMLATYPLGPESMLWFFPWFMGFAILGAGVSGICPALALFKWLGLR